MSKLNYDMRPVYRYSWWLDRWVRYCDFRMVSPCPIKFT